MIPVLGGAPGDALREHATLEAEDAVERELPGFGAPLAEVYGYWKSLAWPGGAPSRADFDPMAIAGALPNVFLAAVEPEDYRFTVVGGRIEERLGGRFTRHRLAECEGLIDVERTRRDFDAMVRHPVPRLERLSGEWSRYEWRRFDRLMLPLVDGGRVAHILGVIDLCTEDRPPPVGYLLRDPPRL
ncbi:MAG: PAS domain-containing protein [Marivibrio sp.]|uniref:PAS domain-containing protein n=1 Tax=Marivibrio sp. TaxID=2039719 RepID=UPI0032F0151A